MTKTHFAFALMATLAVSGCAQFGPSATTAANPGGTTASQSPAPAITATPAQTTALALSSTDIVAFIDPDAGKKLSDKERAEAASAQFYALQFGRPGAPRSWQGEKGALGKVSVGPYVRVNTLVCRDFTHIVTVGGQDYPRSGTACREENGNWSVERIASSG